MEKGFVYVARLIDYNNKFVGNYFKIGKTQQQQYKIGYLLICDKI